MAKETRNSLLCHTKIGKFVIHSFIQWNLKKTKNSRQFSMNRLIGISCWRIDLFPSFRYASRQRRGEKRSLRQVERSGCLPRRQPELRNEDIVGKGWHPILFSRTHALARERKSIKLATATRSNSDAVTTPPPCPLLYFSFYYFHVFREKVRKNSSGGDETLDGVC
jgi:hypothetical protein